MESSDIDLGTKLRLSRSIESLAAEQTVAAELNELGWCASHGMFYVDPVTAKSRELDVIAYQIWQTDEPEMACTIRTLIECKSAKDFHLVFASTPQNMSRNILTSWWIGDPLVTSEVFSALGSSGIGAMELAELRHECDAMVHLSDSLDPLPLRTSRVGTTFRETSIGGEKDLENSVLWRAILTLRSASDALRLRQTETRKEQLVRAALDARIDGRPIRAELQAEFQMLLSHREYYQRVVVIESTLWILSDGALVRVPWCRFEQRDAWDKAYEWVDVVTREAFRDYAQQFTSQFANILAKQGAKLIEA